MSETYGSGSRRVFRQRPPYLGIGLFPPVITGPQTGYTKSLVHMHGAAALSRRPSNRSSTRMLFLRYNCPRREDEGPHERPLSVPLPRAAGGRNDVREKKDGRDSGYLDVRCIIDVYFKDGACTSRAASYRFAHKSHSRQITKTRAHSFSLESEG